MTCNQKKKRCSEVQVFVKSLSGKNITLQLESGDTIRAVKHRISDREGIPYNIQRIISGGKELEDSHTINDYSMLRFTYSCVFLAVVVVVRQAVGTVNVDATVLANLVLDVHVPTALTVRKLAGI